MTRHCCDTMREEVDRTCDEHPDRFECPDVLVHYTPKFDEYGLVVRRGEHDGETTLPGNAGVSPR